MFLKVDNVGAERMCSARLFRVTGPATQKCPVAEFRGLVKLCPLALFIFLSSHPMRMFGL